MEAVPGLADEILFLCKHNAKQSLSPQQFLFPFLFVMASSEAYEVPRLETESELQLQPMPFNPLCPVRDRARVSAASRAVAVRFLTHFATEGIPPRHFLINVSGPQDDVHFRDINNSVGMDPDCRRLSVGPGQCRRSVLMGTWFKW